MSRRVSIGVLKDIVKDNNYDIYHVIGENEQTEIRASDIDNIEEGDIVITSKGSEDVIAECRIRAKKEKKEREYSGDVAKALERTTENVLASFERIIAKQDKVIENQNSIIEKLRQEIEDLKLNADNEPPSIVTHLMQLAAEHPDTVMPLLGKTIEAAQGLLSAGVEAIRDKASKTSEKQLPNQQEKEPITEVVPAPKQKTTIGKPKREK